MSTDNRRQVVKVVFKTNVGPYRNNCLLQKYHLTNEDYKQTSAIKIQKYLVNFIHLSKAILIKKNIESVFDTSEFLESSTDSDTFLPRKKCIDSFYDAEKFDVMLQLFTEQKLDSIFDTDINNEKKILKSNLKTTLEILLSRNQYFYIDGRRYIIQNYVLKTDLDDSFSRPLRDPFEDFKDFKKKNFLGEELSDTNYDYFQEAGARPSTTRRPPSKAPTPSTRKVKPDERKEVTSISSKADLTPEEKRRIEYDRQRWYFDEREQRKRKLKLEKEREAYYKKSFANYFDVYQIEIEIDCVGDDISMITNENSCQEKIIEFNKILSKFNEKTKLEKLTKKDEVMLIPFKKYVETEDAKIKRKQLTEKNKKKESFSFQSWFTNILKQPNKSKEEQKDKAKAKATTKATAKPKEKTQTKTQKPKK